MNPRLNFSITPDEEKLLRAIAPIPNSGTHRGIPSPSMFASEAIAVGTAALALVPPGELPWAKLRELVRAEAARQASRRVRT